VNRQTIIIPRREELLKKPIALTALLVALFSFIANAYSESSSSGVIKGSVSLPAEIDLPAAPKEAKVYVYLSDYTPKEGKRVAPWEAPIKKVIFFRLNSLEAHDITFAFTQLPQGIYSVSVLVDTGRPHVPEGSQNYIAYPGDYAGGTKENLGLEKDQIIEVSINRGLYVTVPGGYTAPLYSPE